MVRSGTFPKPITRSQEAYDYSLKNGATPASSLQIIRNIQNAAKAAGGAVLGDYTMSGARPDLRETANKFLVNGPGGTAWDRYTILKLAKGKSEVLVIVTAAEAYNSYSELFVEREAMKQEVSVNVNELADKLEKDGFLTLYVNFDTNEATIKSDSAKTLDDAAAALKSSPSLKVEVDGHTDNVGTPESNQMLSEARAKAVMEALVARGVVAANLSSKGFGQTAPIGDNRTEEGRAKNRRVELVKK